MQPRRYKYTRKPLPKVKKELVPDKLIWKHMYDFGNNKYGLRNLNKVISAIFMKIEGVPVEKIVKLLDFPDRRVMNKQITHFLDKASNGAVQVFKEKLIGDLESNVTKIQNQLSAKDTLDNTDIRLMQTQLAYYKTMIELYGLKDVPLVIEKNNFIQPEEEVKEVNLEIGSINVTEFEITEPNDEEN